jgi:hypothetical protein
LNFEAIKCDQENNLQTAKDAENAIKVMEITEEKKEIKSPIQIASEVIDVS